MRLPTGKAIILAIGLLITLHGCGDAEQREAGTADDGPLAELYRERVETARRLAAIVRALQEGRCEQGLELLEAAGVGETRVMSFVSYTIHRAVLHIEGKCLARDPALAAELLTNMIALDPLPEAQARLGALYWAGAGVEQDQDKARALFRRAVHGRAADLLGLKLPHALDGLPVLGNLWGMSARDMHHEFVDYLTGPWTLPEPLRAELDWLDQLKAGGGAAIFEASKYFRDGTGGFERNEKLAFNLLETAAADYDHLPALFPFALAVRERRMCPHEESRCDPMITYSNYFLTKAAHLGDIRAQRLIVKVMDSENCHPDEIHDDSPSLREIHYYWLLRLAGMGDEVGEQILRVGQMLKKKERISLEEMARDTEWYGLAMRLPCTESFAFDTVH
ncbi:MAG: hypothetical protein ACE5EM_10235 [Sphingomonadales bacterium]